MATTTAVPDTAAKNGLAVTDIIKMDANRIYGQGTQVYPAKPGAVYKGDITILDTHVLQEIGKNSVILHEKSKLDYASEEFKKTAESLRRPDVAIYYQDDHKNPTDTAKVFPFSPAKDDLERVVAGLKKSAKELNMPNMDNVLDSLAGRSWERNQEIRKHIKDEKVAAKEAKAASLLVKQRVILSRLVVETASNSFHLSMSPSSVLAGGFWSDLYGHDLRNTQALFSTKANDYRHC